MPEISYIDVVAAILWREGRFLAVERPQGKELAGFWEFPGGKVEPGESLEQALARELAEELGLAPHGMCLCHTTAHTYPHKAVRLYFFRIRAFDGRPTPHEGHRLRWLTPAEALELPFLPADQDLVADLARRARRAATQGTDHPGGGQAGDTGEHPCA